MQRPETLDLPPLPPHPRLQAPKAALSQMHQPNGPITSINAKSTHQETDLYTPPPQRNTTESGPYSIVSMSTMELRLSFGEWKPAIFKHVATSKMVLEQSPKPVPQAAILAGTCRFYQPLSPESKKHAHWLKGRLRLHQ